MTAFVQSFWLWELIGKLHPLVVHFPIGLLVTALFLELLTLNGKRPGLREGIYWMVVLGTISAVLATIMGLILHNIETYGGDLVEQHKKGGMITTLLAIITTFLARKNNLNPSTKSLFRFRISLTLSVISLTIAGHLGASLTHGENYLSSVFENNKAEYDSGKAQNTLAEFTANEAGTFSETDLNRLNLEVRAIFAHNCYQCHSKEKVKGGLILQNEAGVMAGGDSGPILKVGNASQSEIIRRLTLPRSDEESMPPKGKILQPAEIELISLWIDQGAHWADEDFKVFREAPLALEKPLIPSTSSPSQNPIDLFLSDYFQANNQAWPDPVSDEVFIRRAYLDAIGLLPSSEQVKDFAANSSKDKRNALIDSLLADSLNYTQHWLSFWNDLLRNDYTGTGFITGGREQISNWLYASLIKNKPYDQMVKELINPEKESRGFIKGIAWRGVVNSSQRTEMQAAQNISQSLLGLNLKCASCHDSFVSNLTLDQAYDFANVFADSSLEIHRCDKPTGRFAKTAFVYPELGKIEAESIKDRLSQLSNIIAKPENGRLYRTMANRIWAELFGRGIITPVDEMDRLPWNQALLDWLAADLIEGNYNLKNTLATIMKSRAYQLPSVGYEEVLDVNSERFVFAGPIKKRLSAEQFADALSQVIYPAYPALTFDPVGDNITATYIWDDEIEVDRRVLPKPGIRYFRYGFDLPKNLEIEKAEIMLAVDHAFILYLNEKEIGKGENWREVKRFDVKDALLKGKNQLAIQGENDGKIPNPAGILLSMKITTKNGEDIFIESNREWKSSKEKKANWISAKYDDSEWKKVRGFGRPLRSKWGRLLDFSHLKDGHPISMGRASLVKLDPFLKALGRPSRENVTTSRDDRATLLQALELTNGDFFNEIIRMGAKKWLDEFDSNAENMIPAIYESAFGRFPSSAERKTALTMLGDKPDQIKAEDFLWSLVLLPEFQVY